MSLRSYHFSLGDSRRGAIGFCARVTARSPHDAVALLQAALPDDIELTVPADRAAREGHAGIEYITVYLNPKGVRPSAIDETDPVRDLPAVRPVR